MEILNKSIIKRWNSVANDIGLEHLMIPGGEIEDKRKYYGVEDGVTVEWLKKETNYWLSCYYEPGHCRCDDRYSDPDEYKIWLSETGKLKRLKNRLAKLDDGYVVKW